MVYFTRHFVLRFAWCCFVLVLLLLFFFFFFFFVFFFFFFFFFFFCPSSIAIASPGKKRANLCAFRAFVRDALIWFIRFPLPLCVCEGLRFVILALPGLFFYLFIAHQWLQKEGQTYLGGSVGCAVRLETRSLRVQPPPRSATFFHGDWSWNIFCGHSLPSADSRRAVVSFCRKNVHNTG